MGQFWAQKFLNNLRLGQLMWCGVVRCVVCGVCSRFSWVRPRFAPPSVGPPSPPPDRPKFRVFSSPATIFVHYFLSLWGSSRGILVVCVGGDPQMCTFGLSKMCTFQGPHHQNSTRRPQEREERKKIVERGKSAKFWAPTLRGPTLRGPTLRGLVFAHPGGREGGGKIGPVAKISIRFVGPKSKKRPHRPKSNWPESNGPKSSVPQPVPSSLLVAAVQTPLHSVATHDAST